MNLLKRLFKTKEAPVRTYEDFWNWFQKNETDFYKVVKEKGNIEKVFFDKLAAKLGELKEGFYYLTGMYDDTRVELIITADGNIKNIVFAEELIAAAPVNNRWKFTALKPALDLKNVNISMAGYSFHKDNMHFYANDLTSYPDQIDIVIVHDDIKPENELPLSNGVYIFLDNYLGELDFAITIDNLLVVGRQDANKELIPIAKLKDYLKWRQKEFIEKYEAIHHFTTQDNYSLLEAELESGNKLFATINTKLLEWDHKASHPWLAKLVIEYDGSSRNGMPDEPTYQLMNDMEEELLKDLKSEDGYLYVGRQTAKNEREVYFACKEFRRVSSILFRFQKKYEPQLKMEYDIYKDKYWQSYERFQPR